jgi:GWxTD domain-containing protein
MNMDINNDELNFIKVEVIQLFNYNDKVEIQLQIKLPTNRLVFKKNIEGFNSEISIDAIFTNKDYKVLFSDNWNFEINKKYFEETKSNQEILVTKNIFIDKDISSLNLIIGDFKNNISWIKNKTIILSENIHLSDIFINKKDDNGYTPILNNELVNIDTLWINFFSSVDNDTINITYNFFIQQINNSDKEIILNKEIEYISNNNNNYPIPIISSFFNGVEIIIENDFNKKTKEILVDRYKEIEYDYSMLVGPMEYILESSNFKKYREYADLNYENKLIYIKNYWFVNENSENSKGNQLLKEFYNRVEYVNYNYNYLSLKGWETDRGKILIIYGYPYDIQNEYTTDGELEIWTYKNNRQYTFINKYGNYILSTNN